MASSPIFIPRGSQPASASSPLSKRTLRNSYAGPSSSAAVALEGGLPPEAPSLSSSLLQQHQHRQHQQQAHSSSPSAAADADILTQPPGQNDGFNIASSDDPLYGAIPTAFQDSSDIYSVSQLIKSGWLYKRSKRKTWNKRWFVLRDNQLIYYKDDREYKPRDIIAVEDVMAVAMLTDQHKPNHFAFFTPSKNYHLRADTIAEAESWVNELKHVIDAASENVLSSSFKRISILESTQQQQQQQQQSPKKANPTHRHTFSATQFGQSNGKHNGTQHKKQRSATYISDLHNDNNNSLPLTFAKRKSINFDPYTLHKEAGAPNSVTPALNAPYSNPDDGLSKLTKSLGSGSIQGSSRSEYMSSIMSATDDVQSSLGSFSHQDTNDEVAAGGALAPPSGVTPAAKPVEPAAVTAASAIDERQAATPTNDGPDINNENDDDVVDDEQEDEIPLPHLDKEETSETGYVLRRKKKYNQWRKVWLVLTNKRILLYKGEKSKSPTKIINLENIIDVMELDAIKSKQYCMQIITPEKRLQFSTSSEEDLTRWIAAIKSAIDSTQSALAH